MKEVEQIILEDYNHEILDSWTGAYCDACDSDIKYGKWCYNEIETSNYICEYCYTTAKELTNANV